MKENYFLDDGAYSALQIIVETARQRVEGSKSITDDILSNLSEPLEASEFRLKLQVGLSGHWKQWVVGHSLTHPSNLVFQLQCISLQEGMRGVEQSNCTLDKFYARMCSSRKEWILLH